MRLIGFLWHSTSWLFLGLFMFRIYFNKKKHFTGLLRKIMFYYVYHKILFLFESFLSSRKLRVLWKSKSPSKCASNARIRQNSYLIHLFFSTSMVSLKMFCVRLLSEQLMLHSTYYKANHLTFCNMLILLEIKIIWKCLYFWSTTFWFWNFQEIWCLKLSIHAQTLKAVTQN